MERFSQALSINAAVADIWNNRGTVLNELERYGEAIADFNKASALQPNYSEAFYNKGKSLSELKRYDEALAAFNEALSLKADLAEAWFGCGNALFERKRYDEAFAAFDKAFVIKPDLAGLEGSRLLAKMYLCNWKNHAAECAHLVSSVRNGNANALPFQFLVIPSAPAEQLQCATLWAADRFPASDSPIWQGQRYDHDRIRVGYLSPDLREHAISHLAAGLIECHDKSRFEVTGLSCAPDDNSEMRQRLRATFERFIDVEKYSDDRIAALIREMEIDILVDLAGFTAHSRTGILARRAAPIQVSYLGYPGTMGAPYIDYIVADRIVIPEDQHKFYAEKIAWLPDSYQANDAKRPVAEKTPLRAEQGLPETDFVFCCFNNNFKIAPPVFERWMRILNRVDGGVLWLLEDNAAAAGNLRKEAAARGVDAARLIFAKRMPLPDHLARHRLAGLFLDTLPYNAHTTASDALWAGLPVLTCRGDTFAGRVAASLLNAMHLPELITKTLDDYERMAIDLATNPEKLAAIQRKLAENRLTTPLFDTGRFTQHIEAAYTAMYRRHHAGLPPDRIIVPD